MSNRTPRADKAQSKHSRLQSPTSSNAADDADHALANIRAWNRLLVARGNRLLELAAREREALAGAKASPRQSMSRAGRDAAVACSSAAGHPDRAGKKNAGPRSKPLA